MPRHKKPYIEFRDYNLPARFPVLLLSGEEWRISDIPSPRLHIHNCLRSGSAARTAAPWSLKIRNVRLKPVM